MSVGPCGIDYVQVTSFRTPLAVSAALAALAAMVALTGAAGAAPGSAAAEAAIAWTPCATDATAQCGTLSVPIDWNHPDGHRFDLALARRTATDPAGRIGSLVFGPGGPGDSGVDRVVTGISRFSPQLRSRFDIVSFDPRGVGRSHPVICSADLVRQQPSPLMTSKADFDATLAYNRRLRADCRARTGPLYDHVDTLSSVRDLDAIRAALGESMLTFHGSSYGTLLGEEYAEAFPSRVRAIVLESVDDHSLSIRSFLDTQAATVQDSFDEFVAWCDRAAGCALHGRDVRAVLADVVARSSDPFGLMVTVQRRFNDPDWIGLAQLLVGLAAGPAAPSAAPPASGTVANPLPAIFCSDWSLPVRDYPAYASHLRRLSAIAPDLYPRALVAPAICLGHPTSVDNPQHRLTVRGSNPLLMINSRHDPATGYNWATNVARQLGREGLLLTYDGWGHTSYTTSPCLREAVDRYLTTQALPARGSSCPAVAPAGAG
jgi:pimeloyl-ACP methyl ester carboxylesterase